MSMFRLSSVILVLFVASCATAGREPIRPNINVGDGMRLKDLHTLIKHQHQEVVYEGVVREERFLLAFKAMEVKLAKEVELRDLEKLRMEQLEQEYEANVIIIEDKRKQLRMERAQKIEQAKGIAI